MTMQPEAQMRALIRREMDKGRMPGGIFALWKDGREVFCAQEGYADLMQRRPLERDSLFRIYSITKPVTAVAAAILMQEGRLRLDDRVADYLPEYADMTYLAPDGEVRPCRREMTVRHLLSMTSGLVYPDPDPAGMHMQRCFDGFAEANLAGRGPSTREVARLIAAQPLAFEPGTDWRYGLSADVLGAVVEVITGMTLRYWMQERIFMPLGMEDTDFYVPQHKQHRLTTLYRHMDGRLQADDTRHLGLTMGLQPPTFESGGAGLYTTLDDYARFGNMLACGGGGIISEATLKLFREGMVGSEFSPALQTDQYRGYRYGCFMRTFRDAQAAGAPGTAGEFGWDGWTGPYVSVDSVNRTLMLFMMQVGGFHDWELTLEMRRIALDALK
ncbi:MAG: beta-lactamase family protein [Clostridia bacterium]|nr:beta-lactamase family protein [Clostridia bacterium]